MHARLVSSQYSSRYRYITDGVRARCGAASQVGHAAGAARALRGLGPRAAPAHKHALAHELRSSRRDSRPSAFFNFSTNLVWNLSESRCVALLAEPLGLSDGRSDARDGGARQYDSDRIAGALR